MKGVFQVKSLDAILADAGRGTRHLRRALGPLQLTLLGLGAIIGAGIFATIGTAAAGDPARPGAGPALTVSFVITAIACTFTALCYAEFAAMVPVSGSAYTYAYATLGELTAWIIGWDLILEYAVGNVAVAISWANYFRTFLARVGVFVPDWLAMDYRSAARMVDETGVSVVFRDAPHLFGAPVVFNLLAASIVAAITLVLVWGIRESARFNAVMVALKILVLTFFVVVGTPHVQSAHWTPFAPNGWSGVAAGAAIVFFAFIGFDAVSTLAEETRHPQRDLPRGIIASLVVSTFIYLVVAAVFTGLISYPDLRARLATEQAEPLTLALQVAAPDLGWAVAVVAFGSVCAHTAVLLVFQLGQPRIFFAMSRDGLLPPLFSRVHSRFQTPHAATILTGVFVAGCAGVASIDEMVDLTNIGTLFAFLLVCVGVIVLRVRDPGRPRPFRVRGGWLLPILGAASCVMLIFYLPPASWLRFSAWLNIGFLVYGSYGCVNSRLTGRDAARGAEVDGAATGGGTTDHAARAARTGLWLAAGGTGLLLATRGLDLALAAGGAAADRGHSLFLLVPMALNGIVLCPIVVHRALGARRSGAPGAGATSVAAAALGAAIVALVVLLVVNGTG